jgi:DNA-binding NtrC family response regulator
MPTILLILENAIEYDLTKTVLVKLGFNVLSLQKGAEMRDKLKEHFPEVVITSVLGKQDAGIEEFVNIRSKRGTPKFIWVGAESRLKKLNEVQLKLIDATLSTPVQPEALIEKVCGLLNMPSQQLIDTYRKLLVGGTPARPPGQSAMIKDEKRAASYAKIAAGIPVQDKVFTAKDLDRFSGKDDGDKNTETLLNKKRQFVRAMFKK